MTVVKRSEVEAHKAHRFLAVPWTRQHDLVFMAEDGAMTLMRTTGDLEHSRFRKNQFPYV